MMASNYSAETAHASSRVFTTAALAGPPLVKSRVPAHRRAEKRLITHRIRQVGLKTINKVDSKWDIVRIKLCFPAGFVVVGPRFGDEEEAGNFDGIAAAAAAGANTFESVALAVGGGGDDEEPEVRRGVAQDVVDHFAMGAGIERANEDIGPGFKKPAFQQTPDSGRGVVGDEAGHWENDEL